MCESQEPDGLGEECLIDPLEGRQAVTAGDWTIEVAGYETGEEPATFRFHLKVMFGQPAEAAGE